ncbi:MAG: Rieske 2Fe-2S domain-containing protein [Frankia sp.]|nr:Rieske 2Fe-2S domain-containing protein [Frankia sp.]
MKHVAAQRIYLTLWDPTAGSENAYPDSAGGFLALSERCPHLGCRIPLCEASKWFECPCHGSRFNRVGEYQFGPAPQGLARVILAVERRLDGKDQLVLDTERTVPGADRGTATIGRDEPSGPHCNG